MKNSDTIIASNGIRLAHEGDVHRAYLDGQFRRGCFPVAVKSSESLDRAEIGQCPECQFVFDANLGDIESARAEIESKKEHHA